MEGGASDRGVTPRYWEDLPVELIMYQLSMLDAKSLWSLALVSKEWFGRVFINGDTLWHRLTLEDWVHPLTGHSDGADVQNAHSAKGAEMSWKEVYAYIVKTRKNYRESQYKHRDWYHNEELAYSKHWDEETMKSYLSRDAPRDTPPGWDTSSVMALALVGKQYLVTGGDDSIVNVWDLDGGLKHSLKIEGNDNVISCILSDGAIVVAGFLDEPIPQNANVAIWNIETGELLHNIKEHRGSIFGMILNDSHLITSGSVDRSIRVWDRKTFQEKWSVLLPSNLSYTDELMEHPQDENLFISSHSDVVLFWDTRCQSSTPTAKIDLGFEARRIACWKNTLAACECTWLRANSCLSLFDLRTNQSFAQQTFEEQSNRVHQMAIDSEYVITGGEPDISVWSAEDLSCIQRLEIPYIVCRLAVGPDHQVIYGTDRGGVFLHPCNPLYSRSIGPSQENPLLLPPVCLREEQPVSEVSLFDCSGLIQDGHSIAASFRDGAIHLFDFRP